MRVNLKIALCLVIIGVFFTTISYWSKCGDAPVRTSSFSVLSSMTKAHSLPGKYHLQDLSKDVNYNEDGDAVTPNGNRVRGIESTVNIDCLINTEYTVGCRRDGHEVYVPFTFLRKYFEVHGKITNVDGHERFEWQHSYSKYYQPKGKYDPTGVFMNFENFNVEARERVKCISAIEGVPVSTQWDVRGYLYPIQIAQFALSHFSKNLTDPPPRVTILEDGLAHQGRWSIPDGTVHREFDSEVQGTVMRFNTAESLQSVGIALALDHMQDFVLSLTFQLESNGSFTVTVEDRERHERYFVHYVCTQMYISSQGNHIYYGMGGGRGWRHLTRDLAIDLRKGLGLTKMTRKVRGNGKLKVIGLTLRGQGSLANVTLSSSAHMAHFFDAAEWLLRNQDPGGGWPVPVERKFNSLGMGNLKPGWYSAMAQGQAISVLTRAYHVTGEERYRQAALQATEPFHLPAAENGVTARFMDKYVWYEEYPTVPSSFVLNGFIYALIGLYDLKEAYGEHDKGHQAALLYDAGVESLKALLPLFDSGTGSFYDLRHFTVGIAPNLARWDYHTTHIGQLLLMATIDDAEVFKTTTVGSHHDLIGRDPLIKKGKWIPTFICDALTPHEIHSNEA